MATPPHPELDKMQAARKEGHSDAIGTFIDWLGEQGYVIARWETPTIRLEPCHQVYNQVTPGRPGGTRPAHRSIGRREPGLCGATPQPYTVDGKVTTGTWYGEISSGARPEDLCRECERMYEAGEWPEKPIETPQLFGVHQSIERWLAEYFGIDQAAVERERRALLESLR